MHQKSFFGETNSCGAPCIKNRLRFSFSHRDRLLQKGRALPGMQRVMQHLAGLMLLASKLAEGFLGFVACQTFGKHLVFNPQCFTHLGSTVPAQQ